MSDKEVRPKCPVLPFATKAQIEAGNLRKEAIDAITRKQKARDEFWKKLNADRKDRPPEDHGI